MHLADKVVFGLAPDSLRSLACDWHVTRDLFARDQEGQPSPPITRLTALTRLELLWNMDVTEVELLRDLPLEELLLLRCPLSIYEQLPSLFTPGALPFLQVLHIEDLQNREAGFTESFDEPSSNSLAEIERGKKPTCQQGG